MAVTMKNVIFLDVTPCGSCKTDVSEDHIASIIRVTRICELGTLAVTSNRSTLKKYYVILSTPMMEAIRSCEMSVLTRAICLRISEDGILH
jgi:hypothetical protein